MRRATAAHEATVIAITSYILQLFLHRYGEEIGDKLLVIQETLIEASALINSEDNERFKKSLNNFQRVVTNNKVEDELDEFLMKKITNFSKYTSHTSKWLRDSLLSLKLQELATGYSTCKRQNI